MKIVGEINKKPMGLDALLENQLAHRPKFQKFHIHWSSFPSHMSQGGEVELIFALWAVVSEILADYKNCHIL